MGARGVVIGVVAVVAVIAASVAAWTGANSPKAQWFGRSVSHGSRSGNEVALTFDDGPNATSTIAIRDLLDARGLKATFFQVGKAVAARPDITRQLVASGDLIGNHSYHHDYLRWLDPRYPELGRTQRAVDRAAGVCPRFFRPPHGQHTPFMASVVHRDSMRMVLWDVSVGDWKARDPAALARRVLAKVRPGSVIDLHDGLDGKPEVDRRVLVDAMPMILDGLAQRHLEPVRLDQLLGVPGYLSSCGRGPRTSTRSAAIGMTAASMTASRSLVRDR